jgi:hypothetical protein
VLRTIQLPVQQALPPVYRWQQPERPLPRRAVRRPPGGAGRKVGLEAPPWLHSGPDDRPFDFCDRIRRLCADIAAKCDDLRHIDTSRLLFAVTQARSGVTHGLQARVTPLRFRHGQLLRKRGGVLYQVQRYVVDGVEMLYLVTFCLPRFLDQTFEEKLVTLFHELYHVSPAFEGDLRTMGGRCRLHSRDKRAYDAHMLVLARAYLSGGADPDLNSFLRMDFAQLMHRHGSVVGVMVPRPRLLPILEKPLR